MAKIISNVGKTTKQLAQDAARKIVKEPFEVLKTAKDQVAGEEVAGDASQGPQNSDTQTAKVDNEGRQEKVKEKDMHLIQALEAEIKEIREQKERKEEEEKIKEGQAAQAEEEPKPLVEPTPKKSRKLFGFGQKAQAEKLQTRVEKPVPPSG